MPGWRSKSPSRRRCCNCRAKRCRHLAAGRTILRLDRRTIGIRRHSRLRPMRCAWRAPSCPWKCPALRSRKRFPNLPRCRRSLRRPKRPRCPCRRMNPRPIRCPGPRRPRRRLWSSTCCCPTSTWGRPMISRTPRSMRPKRHPPRRTHLPSSLRRSWRKRSISRSSSRRWRPRRSRRRPLPRLLRSLRCRRRLHRKRRSSSRRISHPNSSWKSPRAHRICTQPAPSPRFPRSPRCPRRKASMQPRLRRSMRPSRSSSTCALAYRCTTSTSTKRTNGRDGWSRRCRSGRWSCTDRCPIRRWRWPIPSQAAPPPWGSRRCRKWRACWSMRCSTCSCSRAACPSRRSASMRQPTTSAACCTSSPPVSSRSPTRSCWSSCKPSCRPR